MLSTRISKTMAGMSIKCSCQRAFITKQPYLDHSFCQLIYLCPKHKNKQGMVCNGKDVVGYRHFLGSQLSNGMKAHLMDLIRQGLSPVQVMAHHKVDVREKALQAFTHDTFVLPFDVKNLAKKRVDKLWQKHPKNPINVRMWVMENPKSMFYYVEHVLMDLNFTSQYHTPFILGIKTRW